MEYYSQELIEAFDQQNFAFIEVEVKEHVCYITLDREEKKNAIHPQMVFELAYVFQYVMAQSSIWICVMQAKGNVFCAGADLKAFMGGGAPHDSSIPKPEQEVLIGPMFHSLHKPMIARVNGDVYAGGFFFLTGSHIVLASDHIKLGLPEVKRGLYPFQVMAELQRVMPTRKVLDWCIRGYTLPVTAAAQYGLLTKVVSVDQLDQEVEAVIAELKGNSPMAMRLGLEAFQHTNSSESDHAYLSAMLGKAVGSKDGQEGLRAFREKRKPNWTGQ
ncbi:MAG: enoyl-CoA hydratase-related protein [Bacteroidota bacterium]